MIRAKLASLFRILFVEKPTHSYTITYEMRGEKRVIKGCIVDDKEKKTEMNKFYRVLILLLCSASLKGYAQQAFTYTQFIDNLTPINHAWSVTQEGSAVNVLSRKQWVGIDGAPMTVMANGYMPISGQNATVGFTMLSDKVAIENLTEVNLFGAKSVRLSDETYLAVGLNFGFRNYEALYSQLDPNDPEVINGDVIESRANVGASVMMYMPGGVGRSLPGSLYVGVSIPRIAFRTLGAGSTGTTVNQKNFYFFTAGYNYPVTPDIDWNSAAVVAYTANLPVQADFSTKMWFNHALGVGLNYRASNEIAVLSSFKTGNVNIGYSYQFGASSTKLAGFNRGTHEVSISLRFGNSGSSMEKIPFR